MGHVVTENRYALVVAARTTMATGVAVREASVAMKRRLPRGRRSTLGGDKGYDTAAHVRDLRKPGVTPQVAQNDTGQSSAIDDRTTTHGGYEISLRKRKAIEQVFGWDKTLGPRPRVLDVHVHPGGPQPDANEKLAMPDVIARRSEWSVETMENRTTRAHDNLDSAFIREQDSFENPLFRA